MYQNFKSEFIARGILFLVAFVIILLFCFFTTGCLTNKTVQKMLEREDVQCKQAIKLAVAASRPVTSEKITIHDTVIITPGTRIDTAVVFKHDTLWNTITKNTATIQWRIQRDTIQIKADCPQKTTIVTLTDTIRNTAFTPAVLNTGIFADSKKESNSWLYVTIISLILLWAFTVVYYNRKKAI